MSSGILLLPTRLPLAPPPSLGLGDEHAPVVGPEAGALALEFCTVTSCAAGGATADLVETSVAFEFLEEDVGRCGTDPVVGGFVA